MAGADAIRTLASATAALCIVFAGCADLESEAPQAAVVDATATDATYDTWLWFDPILAAKADKHKSKGEDPIRGSSSARSRSPTTVEPRCGRGSNFKDLKQCARRPARLESGFLSVLRATACFCDESGSTPLVLSQPPQELPAATRYSHVRA